MHYKIVINSFMYPQARNNILANMMAVWELELLNNKLYLPNYELIYFKNGRCKWKTF